MTILAFRSELGPVTVVSHDGSCAPWTCCDRSATKNPHGAFDLVDPARRGRRDVGIGIIAAEVAFHQWDSADAAFKRGYSAIGMTTRGAFFAQLAIGVLGVLVVTSEYVDRDRCGRRSPRCHNGGWCSPPRRCVLHRRARRRRDVEPGRVPRRAGAAGDVQAENFSASLRDPAAFRVVVGAGLFVACMGLLGFALGAVLRSSAGAVTALVGLVFFLPMLSELLPEAVKENVTRYLPSNAGAAIHRVVQTGGNGPDVLSPGMGLAVLLAWSFAALGVAAFIVHRRDA